jgi:hypothetical protein
VPYADRTGAAQKQARTPNGELAADCARESRGLSIEQHI